MGENIFWNKYDNVVVICASHNKWHSGISFEWEHWEGPGSSSAQIWIPSSKGCFVISFVVKNKINNGKNNKDNVFDR